MKNTDGKQISCVLSYISFLLSGMFIFSPLHKAQNITVSLISLLITALLFLLLIIYFINLKHSILFKKSHSLLSLICCIFSTFASLMLITEIIKDVAYVADRGISLYYYIILMLAILTVDLYLSLSSEKGMFRFLILSFIPFILLFLMIPFCFITTKTAVLDNFFSHSSAYFQSAILGIKTGIFLASDSSVFVMCFRNQICNKDYKLPVKSLISGLLISFMLIAIYNIITVMVFGNKLTQSIDDPDYAIIKLIPGIDVTESISVIRIVSFLIKASVYISFSSKALSRTILNGKITHKSITLILHILIPVIVITLAYFDPKLGYGAFQHMILPIVAGLSLVAVFISDSIMKKNE